MASVDYPTIYHIAITAMATYTEHYTNNPAVSIEKLAEERWKQAHVHASSSPTATVSNHATIKSLSLGSKASTPDLEREINDKWDKANKLKKRDNHSTKSKSVANRMNVLKDSLGITSNTLDAEMNAKLDRVMNMKPSKPTIQSLKTRSQSHHSVMQASLGLVVRRPSLEIEERIEENWEKAKNIQGVIRQQTKSNTLAHQSVMQASLGLHARRPSLDIEERLEENWEKARNLQGSNQQETKATAQAHHSIMNASLGINARRASVEVEEIKEKVEDDWEKATHLPGVNRLQSNAPKFASIMQNSLGIKQMTENDMDERVKRAQRSQTSPKKAAAPAPKRRPSIAMASLGLGPRSEKECFELKSDGIISRAMKLGTSRSFKGNPIQVTNDISNEEVVLSEHRPIIPKFERQNVILPPIFGSK